MYTTVLVLDGTCEPDIPVGGSGTVGLGALVTGSGAVGDAAGTFEDRPAMEFALELEAAPFGDGLCPQAANAAIASRIPNDRHGTGRAGRSAPALLRAPL